MKRVLLFLLAALALPARADDVQGIYWNPILRQFQGQTRASGMVGFKQGVTDGTDACAGCVGEYVETLTTTTSLTGSNTFIDMASLTIPSAGEWDVAFLTMFTGGTSVSGCDVFVATASGNVTTGRVTSTNYCAAAAPTSGNDTSCALDRYRLKTTGAQTIYQKVRCSYTGAPATYGHINARRAR